MRILRVRITVTRLMTTLVILWLQTAGAQQVTFRLPDDDPNTNSDVMRSAAFSPDGLLLAVGYGRFTGMLQEPRPGQAVLWDARSGSRKVTIRGRTDGVCSVAFSPDGKSLAVTEYPGIVRLCAVADGRERLTIKAPAWTTGSTEFSPDGRRLATGLWTGSKDGVSPPGNDVVAWDTESGKTVLTLKGHTEGILALAISPDGGRMLSGGWDGIAKVWDAKSGQALATLEFARLHMRLGIREPVVPVESVDFSPDGRTFATSTGVSIAAGRPEGLGEVTFWSTSTLRETATLNDYDVFVKQLAFSPDGKLLATAGGDGTVRLWDTSTHREVGATKGRPPIAFSRDGQTLVACVAEGTLGLLKVADTIRP